MDHEYLCVRIIIWRASDAPPQTSVRCYEAPNRRGLHQRTKLTSLRFFSLNTVWRKILYIKCLSFLVYTKFIYDGGKNWSFKSLDAVVLLSPLSHMIQLSQSLTGPRTRYEEALYEWNLCVLILHILPFVCMVLVCLWSLRKWLYQSDVVTCQLPWNTLIHH